MKRINVIMQTRSTVHLIDTKIHQNLKRNLGEGLSRTIDLGLTFENRNVLLNAHLFAPGSVSHKYNMTDLELISHLSDIARANGAKSVFVVANPANHVTDIEKFYDAMGMMNLTGQDKFYWFNLTSRIRGTTVDIDRDWVIINVTLPKTHNELVLGTCLENFAMGYIFRDSRIKLYDSDLAKAIVEKNVNLRGRITIIDIMDGRYGQEGWGPYFGSQIDPGFMIFGKDPVAIDAITARLLSYSPSEIPVINNAKKMDFGDIDPIVEGDNIEPIKIIRSPDWRMRLLGEDEQFIAVCWFDEESQTGYRRDYKLEKLEDGLRYELVKQLIEPGQKRDKEAAIYDLFNYGNRRLEQNEKMKLF